MFTPIASLNTAMPLATWLSLKSMETNRVTSECGSIRAPFAFAFELVFELLGNSRMLIRLYPPCYNNILVFWKQSNAYSTVSNAQIKIFTFLEPFLVLVQCGQFCPRTSSYVNARGTPPPPIAGGILPAM